MINPADYVRVQSGEEWPVAGSKLIARMIKAGPLFLTDREGNSMVVGFGTHFNETVPPGCTVRSTVDFSIFYPEARQAEPGGDAFTVVDLREQNSSIDMVKLALRQMQLKQNRELASLREEAKRLRQEAQKPKPIVREPEVVPDVEPDGDDDA